MLFGEEINYLEETVAFSFVVELTVWKENQK